MFSGEETDLVALICSLLSDVCLFQPGTTHCDDDVCMCVCDHDNARLERRNQSKIRRIYQGCCRVVCELSVVSVCRWPAVYFLVCMCRLGSWYRRVTIHKSATEINIVNGEIPLIQIPQYSVVHHIHVIRFSS